SFVAFFFFFFQAEDGIRDKLVTGVQTCALPILLGGPRGDPRFVGEVDHWFAARTAEQSGVDVPMSPPPPPLFTPFRLRDLLLVRSEERRVGKECRCRWWRERCKRR